MAKVEVSYKITYGLKLDVPVKQLMDIKSGQIKTVPDVKRLAEITLREQEKSNGKH
jgi:hypothetical protein